MSVLYFLNLCRSVRFFYQKIAPTEMHSPVKGSQTEQFPNNIELPKGENLITFWS